MGDKIKLGLALIIALAAVGGFYFYAEQSLLLRVVGLLVAVGIAVAIAVQTEAGRNVWAFGRGASVEIRKVVWPSRKETVQTTLMVLVMVVIVGIILWMFDMFVAWGVGYLTGQGS
ncbi:MAG: preprotein translocase subunit SecE [Gammaproteobacteria bacterium]|nr:preprotein translocase subunit SecE [Gammaproteobacteria bacterium]MCW8982825.1 preprotein translocase subunit SecE [Gammaproteobacteria bacterium]